MSSGPFPVGWQGPTRCPVCGAAVSDAVLHENWHRGRHDVQIPTVPVPPGPPLATSMLIVSTSSTRLV